MKINLKTKYSINKWILYGLLSVLIGVFVGVVDYIFSMGITLVTNVRLANPIIFTALLPVAGLAIVYIYDRFGKGSQRGMGLVFSVGFGEEKKIPKRMVPFAIIATWLSHLFGGSVGREGVAVQIGADISQNIGAKLPHKDASRTFLITGMAAGFAGLFGTPIAATLFAIEVLTIGRIEYRALYTSFIASFTASTVTHALGLTKSSFILGADTSINGLMFFKLVALGTIFGLVGRIFAVLHLRGKAFFKKLVQNPLERVFIFGMFLSVCFIFLHHGRYSGLGESLVEAAFMGEKIYIYDWILKMLLTIATLSVGYQGGEVTPLFSIGATLGTVIAGFMGVPVKLCAALGYVGVFGGATNTFFASILIGGEIFGFEYIPQFFIVCVVSHIVSGSKSIYAVQRKLS